MIRHEENFRDWAQPRLGLPDVLLAQFGEQALPIYWAGFTLVAMVRRQSSGDAVSETIDDLLQLGLYLSCKTRTTGIVDGLHRCDGIDGGYFNTLGLLLPVARVRFYFGSRAVLIDESAS